jgi:hypothetical protein
LAPSNALAVTTWNWSFAAEFADEFGSGTFTTADVVPTAGTTYQITGASGTYNQGGSAYSITGILSDSTTNQFQWSGTSSSPILADQYVFIGLDAGVNSFILYNPISGFTPIFILLGSTHSSVITSSSLAPYSPPSTAVPGPLPLLGAAAAFQASRRLRRRLNGSLPAA